MFVVIEMAGVLFSVGIRIGIGEGMLRDGLGGVKSGDEGELEEKIVAELGGGGDVGS